MKRLINFSLVVFLLSLPVSLYADRGSIPFKPNVRIFEPNQRAMIAWNGNEEILLLSTDLKASEPTKVLEVIPLPSEPVVKKGDVEVFKKANDLINRKLAASKRNGGKSRTKGAYKTPERPAGKITFHKKIGAHDISVANVLNGAKFVDWVEKYLKQNGVDNPVIPGPLKKVIIEYIDDDFKWFVFDVIELDQKPITNQAIQYRFKSDFLYYPLRITRTETGHTNIDLLILTPKLLSRFPGLPAQRVKLRHKPVNISSYELMRLNKEMHELLGKKFEYKLRIWRITGKLSEFDADLIADYRR